MFKNFIFKKNNQSKLSFLENVDINKSISIDNKHYVNALIEIGNKFIDDCKKCVIKNMAYRADIINSSFKIYASRPTINSHFNKVWFYYNKRIDKQPETLEISCVYGWAKTKNIYKSKEWEYFFDCLDYIEKNEPEKFKKILKSVSEYYDNIDNI